MSAYDTPIPGAAGYANAELLAKTAYGNALTRLNQQRVDTLHQYGYLADVDPESGTLANTRVDPNNPYGQFQQLLRSGAGNSQHLHDSVVGRGIGGGLAHQAEAQGKYDFGQGSFTLGNSLQNALHGYQDAQTQAGQTRDQSVVQAQLAAARDAIAQENFNTAQTQAKDYQGQLAENQRAFEEWAAGQRAESDAAQGRWETLLGGLGGPAPASPPQQRAAPTPPAATLAYKNPVTVAPTNPNAVRSLGGVRDVDPKLLTLAAIAAQNKRR